MTLSTTLLAEAGKLRDSCEEYVAVSMLKQAGLTEQDARVAVAQTLMEKEAAQHISATGIDYDEALRMVKAANINIGTLQNFAPEKTPEEKLADLLEKAASDVSDMEKKAAQTEVLLEKIAALELRVKELQATIDSTPQVVDMPEPITKLAQSGDFTNDDLAALMALPSDLLTKVASVQSPWKMGHGSQPASSGDPFADFLLS
jgi:hypothetical protein